MVTRYNAHGYMTAIRQDDFGTYVTHADYKALEDSWREYAADVDALRKLANDRYNEIERLTAELAECRKDALRWKFVREKLYLSGNGDGTCSMGAVNLPERNDGWPEVGKQREYLDNAIDNAIARSK